MVKKSNKQDNQHIFSLDKIYLNILLYSWFKLYFNNMYLNVCIDLRQINEGRI